MPRPTSVLAIALVTAVVAGCGGAPPAATGPPLALHLAALDGGELELASLRGRIVVLHLFDSGGAAAIADTAPLEALHRREPRRVAVVGVALDLAGYPVVAPWRRALGLTYLVTLADPGVRAGESPLGVVRTTPTTIVLDRSGRVAARVEGQLRSDQLDRLVAPLLDPR